MTNKCPTGCVSVEKEKKVRKSGMRWYDYLVYILLTASAVNWGLFGLDESYNLVYKFTGIHTAVATTIYIIIGIAGIYSALILFKLIKLNRR